MSDLGSSRFEPGRVWSLWEMLDSSAVLFLRLGERIQEADVVMSLAEQDLGGPIDADDVKRLSQLITAMHSMCMELRLDVSAELLQRFLKEPPKTAGEFRILRNAIIAELKNRLFLYVHADKSRYYNSDSPIESPAAAAFPNAAQELRQAGNAYAVDLPIASVYHCMRGLEYGLRALATDLKVTVGTQSWHGVITDIENAIGEERKGPGGEAKNARLQFLSDAASEFRYFKDGWRNYASHVKVNYDDAQALRIFEHVWSFMESLSAHLKE